MTLTEWLDATETTPQKLAETLDMTASMVSQILRGVKPISGIDAMRLVEISNNQIDLDGLKELYGPFMGRRRVKRGGRPKK